MLTASAALPVTANTQPLFAVPNAFRSAAPFSAAIIGLRNRRLIVSTEDAGQTCDTGSAYMKVAAWPNLRAHAMTLVDNAPECRPGLRLRDSAPDDPANEGRHYARSLQSLLTAG